MGSSETAPGRRRVTDSDLAALAMLLSTLFPRRAKLVRVIRYTFRETALHFAIPPEHVHQQFACHMVNRGEVGAGFFQSLCFCEPTRIDDIVRVASRFGIEEVEFDQVKTHIEIMRAGARRKHLRFGLTVAVILLLLCIVVVQLWRSKNELESGYCAGSALMAEMQRLHKACVDALGQQNDACKPLELAGETYQRQSEGGGCVSIQDRDVGQYSRTIKNSVRAPDCPGLPPCPTLPPLDTKDRASPPRPPEPKPKSTKQAPRCLEDKNLKAMALEILRNDKASAKYLSGVAIPLQLRLDCEGAGGPCHYRVVGGLEASPHIRGLIEDTFAHAVVEQQGCGNNTIEILATKKEGE